MRVLSKRDKVENDDETTRRRKESSKFFRKKKEKREQINVGALRMKIALQKHINQRRGHTEGTRERERQESSSCTRWFQHIKASLLDGETSNITRAVIETPISHTKVLEEM